MSKRKDSQQGPTKERRPINGDTLQAAVAWATDSKIFAQLKPHGNTSWLAVDLVALTVVWVWSGHATLTGAFAEARRWSLQVLGRVAVGTFQGLLKALVTWTKTLLPLLQERLHCLMQEHGGGHWRVGGWLALAVDGSRISVPRTLANEKEFCAPNHGRGKKAKYLKKRAKARKRARSKAKKKQPVQPQIWLTLLWHMGLQMPWSWRSGPSNASERAHLQQLVTESKFPEKTLFCCDAGFTGYELWDRLLDAGHSFLIRVGANVTLLRKLGYVHEGEGIVYFWPKRAMGQKKPPLVLRLLRLRVGKCSMCLVTNVLDKKGLNDEQAIELYRLRWGVELQFRAMKQTFGRRKLRSRNPERALVELDWSLVGLWLIQLFAVKEQIEIGEVPADCSVGLAIQVIRTMFQDWAEHSEESLATKLQGATKDKYKRQSLKKGRYRPQKKDKPAAKKPNIINATKEHKANLKRNLKNAA